jgi:hypothetical protein
MTLLQQAEQDMYRRLQEMARNNAKGVSDLKKREVSQATRAVQRILFADLPTPAAEYEGWLYVVTNGRKSGEGTGTGTGVLVVCLNGSDGWQWRRVTADNPVTA